jgi:aspartyl-tRNA(Asn)/glutamyl-tRNA(Gln) amidotransferase subunit A
VPAEFFGEGVDPAVAGVVRRAIDRYSALGAVIVPCSMPSMRFALAAYYVTCTSEASSNLARYDGVRYGAAVDSKKSWHDAFRDHRQQHFGEEVRRRILLGTFALSAGYYGKYYGKAQVARDMVREDFRRLFSDVDLIAGPTMPSVAWKFGEKSDPLAMYLSDVLTVPANLAGIPAISIPCGDVQGLPVGLQLMGRSFEDERVIDAAAAFEEEVRR